MISVGESFLSKTPFNSIEHLYIIIGIIETQALFVNVTTKKDNSDCSCVLNKGDHSFIQHPSVINYADAKDCEINKIEIAIQKNVFKKHKSVSPKLLNKIISGAKTSDAFLPKYLKYIK